MERNNIISDFLNEFNRPDLEKFVEKNTAITDKIYAVLEERGLKPADLAKMLDKSPSEVSKWLSGMHNLTLKSITKIEAVLGIDLVHIDAQKEYVYLKIKVNEKKSAVETPFEPSHYTKEVAGYY